MRQKQFPFICTDKLSKQTRCGKTHIHEDLHGLHGDMWRHRMWRRDSTINLPHSVVPKHSNVSRKQERASERWRRGEAAAVDSETSEPQTDVKQSLFFCHHHLVSQVKKTKGMKHKETTTTGGGGGVKNREKKNESRKMSQCFHQRKKTASS